jgi:aspartate aminotransferase
MEMLRDICLAHDLFFISDEVYREFLYDGVAFSSILDLPEIADRAILLDSTSKQLSSCGARIGRIVCKNHALMERVLRFGQARLCPPTVGQVAALEGIKTPRAYFERVVEDYRRRRDVCHAALSSMPDVVCHKPEGAFYITAKLLEVDTEQFAAWLLSDFSDRKETVMVAPAAGFYMTPGLGWDEIRLAYVINCKDLARAMEVLAKGLETYRTSVAASSERRVVRA